MDFRADSDGARISSHGGKVAPQGHVSKGTHVGESKYPCRPLAWLQWEDPYGEGYRCEFTAFLQRGDIIHLQEVLATMLGELDAAQKDYDERAPQKE